MVFVAVSIRLGPYVITDDAYIGYRFAENVASGQGFVFNIGERVEGYSNFLWIVSLAGLIRLGVEPVAGSKVLGVVCGVGTILSLLSLASRVAPNRRATSGIPALLLASSMPFCLWSVGGMETVLYTFLLVVSLRLYIGEFQREGGLPVSAVGFVGVALARPEGPLLFLTVFMMRAARALREERLRALVLWSSVFVILYGGYFLWRWTYFDSLLPNTVYAKSGGGLRRVMFGMGYVYDFLRFNEGVFFYLLAFGVTVGKYGVGHARGVIAACCLVVVGFTI